METKRNFANIARRVIAPDDDGQNLQPFMSDSPWSSQAVFNRIQAEIRERLELQGGMLTLDESGDECSGPQKAGAARQYLGRLGKVDLVVCQRRFWWARNSLVGRCSHPQIQG